MAALGAAPGGADWLALRIRGLARTASFWRLRPQEGRHDQVRVDAEVLGPDEPELFVDDEGPETKKTVRANWRTTRPFRRTDCPRSPPKNGALEDAGRLEGRQVEGRIAAGQEPGQEGDAEDRRQEARGRTSGRRPDVLPAKPLNRGRTTQSRSKASPRPRNDRTRDSPRNCLTISERRAPVTLRSPTSLPRLAERAVARFMKLMQARRRMAAAARENRVSVEALPWA